MEADAAPSYRSAMRDTIPPARSSSPAWIDAAILAVTLVPLLLTAHLPLSDLPNHLARQFVLRDWATSPALQAYYGYHWALVPNLALELFVTAARAVMPIEWAMRLFCIATVAMLFLGTRAVNRTLAGPQSRLYRAAPLLCYGGPFQFGFLSFCFGVGASLLFFALYLRMRRGPVAPLMATMLAAAALLLLCHLAAFGLFALATAGHALGTEVAKRERGLLPRLVRAGAVHALFLLPPFLLFSLLSPTAGEHGAIDWPTLREKIESIAAITLFSSPRIELALLAVALAGLAAGLLAGALRFTQAAWAILALMLLAWLAMPRGMIGSGYLDYRLPWAMSFYALALLTPGPRWAAWRRPLGAGFLLLGLARVATIALFWLSWEPLLGRIDADLARLPEGARLMVVDGGGTSVSAARAASLLHVASYAIIRAHAFEPNFYASISGQMMRFQPAWKPLMRIGNPKSIETAREIDPVYDHLLVLEPGTAHLAPGLPLRRIDGTDRFTLYAIERRP
jgi:hypothetical protein